MADNEVTPTVPATPPSSPQGQEETETSDEVDSSLTCPICRDLYVKPRIFACGHMLCEPCSIRLDETTEKTDGAVKEYRCPTCRLPTLTPFHRRPICHGLDSICERQHPKLYAERLASYEHPEIVPEEITQQTQLSTIARKARISLAFAVYRRLLPLLMEAALDAHATVRINHEETVHDAERIIDLLSLLLFSHGVYRCAINRTYEGKFLRVDFSPGDSDRTEFVNHNYQVSDPILSAVSRGTDLDSDDEAEEVSSEDDRSDSEGDYHRGSRPAVRTLRDVANVILEQRRAQTRSQDLVRRSRRMSSLRMNAINNAIAAQSPTGLDGV